MPTGEMGRISVGGGRIPVVRERLCVFVVALLGDGSVISIYSS